MFVRGNRSNTLQRYDFKPGVHADPERRVRREREQVRQEVAQLIHQVNQRLAILDADVDVEAEDQVGARDDLQVLDDLQVALVGVDVLRAPVGEGMGRAGDELQPVLFGEADHPPPQVPQIRRRVLDRLVHARAHLDHRLVHLGLHAFVQLALALLDDLHLDVRAEIERVRIDRLVFLLDARA